MPFEGGGHGTHGLMHQGEDGEVGTVRVCVATGRWKLREVPSNGSSFSPMKHEGRAPLKVGVGQNRA